jgi:uncharacterized phage protein (TIGR02220 family)
MGVKDIRVSTTFLDHPKIIMLEAELGVDGIKSLMRLWFYAGEYHTTGFINKPIKYIEIACKWSGEKGKFISTLLDLNLLDQIEDGFFYIHNWSIHNEWASKFEERSAKSRRANNVKYSTTSKNGYKNNILKSKTRTPKKQNEDSSNSNSGTPPFPSLPSPSLQKESNKEKDAIKSLASFFVGYLNQKTGRTFKVTDKVTGDIKNRRAELYKDSDYKTDEDIKRALQHVINVTHESWSNDPTMKKHINPTTLLRPSKFPTYLLWEYNGKGLGKKVAKNANDAFKDWLPTFMKIGGEWKNRDEQMEIYEKLSDSEKVEFKNKAKEQKESRKNVKSMIGGVV